jgi:hypothetical protein
MSKVSRADKLIAAAIVAVLVVLLVVALQRHSDHRSAAARPAEPAAVTGSSRSAAPTTSTAPPSTAASSSTSPSSTTSSAPAATTAPTATTATSTPTTALTGTVTAVGDSIMLDIQSDLEADIPGVQVDGLVSRQFETGIGIVQADRAAGTLGNILVVELGTNGTVTSSDFDAMMQAASGVKRVVFVNVDVPRSWEAPDNAVLAAGVARYPGVAVLADWYALSSPHPEWFTPDQVHLQPAGAQALAALITRYA